MLALSTSTRSRPQPCFAMREDRGCTVITPPAQLGSTGAFRAFLQERLSDTGETVSLDLANLAQPTAVSLSTLACFVRILRGFRPRARIEIRNATDETRRMFAAMSVESRYGVALS